MKTALTILALCAPAVILAQSPYGQYSAPLTLMMPSENWEQRRQNKALEMELLSEVAWQTRKRQFFEEVLQAQQAYKRAPNAPIPKRSTYGFVPVNVGYRNLKTGHEADYTLGVRVTDYRVDAIMFSDGGTLHDGPNNSDYAYGCMVGSDKFLVAVLYRNGTKTLYFIPFQKGITD